MEIKTLTCFIKLLLALSLIINCVLASRTNMVTIVEIRACSVLKDSSSPD